MTLLRKFYNTEVAEAGGGNAEPVVETKQEVPKEEMSIAAAMAKHGKKSDENSTAPKPIDIGFKPEPKKEEPTPAATAKVEEPEKAKIEPEKKEPIEEPKKEEPVQKVQPQKELTLDEVLKREQPNTILKALGFSEERIGLVESLQDVDPKVVGIIEAYKNGTLGDYVRELSTDYQKMTAEEVMRHQLRREYPKATEKALQALYEAEVVEKYKLDPDSYSEAEIERGRLLLEAKADKFRDDFSANQEKYLMPPKPEPKQPPAPEKSVEQINKENLEAYEGELRSDPYIKDIFANKKLTLGTGETKLDFDVDPEALVANLANPEKWVSTMYDKVKGEDGNFYSVPKTKHQMLVAAVAEYGEKMFEKYAEHWKGLGSKAVADPIENAKPPEGTTPAKAESAPTSMAAAMATKGRRVDPVM